MKPFLTAVWSDLILASYPVPDDALTPYLRPGLTPDRWQQQQMSFVEQTLPFRREGAGDGRELHGRWAAYAAHRA